MAKLLKSSVEIFHIDSDNAYTSPQVGQGIRDIEGRYGVVIEVIDYITAKVVVKEYAPKAPKRKSTRRVATEKRHGIAWLVAIDTMDAVNAAYAAA